MIHDIFISYSRRDSEVVERIEEELIKYGITYFIDRSVNVGEDFAKIITKALYECQVVLFVWSKNSNNSEWTEREVRLALSFNKIIVPFQIETFPRNNLYDTLSHIETTVIDVFNEPEVIQYV